MPRLSRGPSSLSSPHPIKGGGGEVEDHSKASGLDLRKPRGAQAVGLVWRGESGDINQRASNEGHSRQAVVIPFYSCVEQVFAVFIFKRFPLMMHTLVLHVIGNHLFVAQSVGEGSVLFSPSRKLRE